MSQVEKVRLLSLNLLILQAGSLNAGYSLFWNMFSGIFNIFHIKKAPVFLRNTVGQIKWVVA